MMKLLVLDFDGTLADTVPHVINCILKCIEKFDLRKLSYDDVLKFNGAVLQDVLLELGATKEMLPEIKKYYSEIFLTDLSDIVLYPNVYETLVQLKNKGIKLTIATNRGRNTMIPLLKHLNLENLIDFVICESDVKNKKPNPDMVEKIKSEYGVSSEDILIVGDTKFDILMGKNCNSSTCIVYYEEKPNNNLIENNPDYLIGDFSELINITFNSKRI